MGNSWEKTMVQVDCTIENVIAVINEASMYRVALVVDENKRLIGTITDGDVRRAIMRHIPLTETVRKVMNDSPFVVHESEDKQKIRMLLEREDILQVPIVNDNYEVTGIETLHNLSKKQIQQNHVVIMAGGYGTRLKPLTDDCPKPMLSVGDKPLLEHIINELKNYGFHKFVLTVHYLSEKILNYFGHGEQWGVDIQYHYEHEPLGTAGALSAICDSDKHDAPYIIINGDVLTKVHYTHLIHFHEVHEADITVCMRKYYVDIPYGVVRYEGHKLISIQEKPTIRQFVNAGLYVINPGVLKQLSLEAPYHMTDLIANAKKEGFKVVVFPIHEYWVDIGRIDEYRGVNREFCEILDV
ncbi:MAG: nucleotidyltransferase family protein [Gammaproteobacteria bacterium]|nr:nucleotidyltransferase family protein [Gammaproteobacteria bacterium]